MKFTEEPNRFNQFTPNKLPFCCVCMFALLVSKKKEKEEKKNEFSAFFCEHYSLFSSISKIQGKQSLR